MDSGGAERLARWAASVEQVRREAAAQLARPLSSPGLRCACALAQALRLGRVIGEGAAVIGFGVAGMRAYAQTGQRAAALRLGCQVVTSAGTVGRAGGLLLRASLRAWREGRAARSAPCRPRQESPMQRIRRALTLGRAAWLAWGGMGHDRI